MRALLMARYTTYTANLEEAEKLMNENLKAYGFPYTCTTCYAFLNKRIGTLRTKISILKSIIKLWH